jgi:LuxR family maltose regulon positive regulatory protein
MIDDILTPREKETIRLICKGLSNKEIAQVLNVKLPTVHTWTVSIMQKVNVSTYDKLDRNVKRLRVAIVYLKEHKELLDEL